MKLNRKIIYLAGFIFALPIALTSYINSSFLEEYLNPYYVSLVYVVASIITILGLLEMPRWLSKLGNRILSLSLSLVMFVSLMLLAFSTTSLTVVAAFLLYFVSSNFLIASLDIFVEDLSRHSSIGKFRGLYLMIINLAWVGSQMISGTIIKASSYRGIYLIAAIFMVILAGIFMLTLRNFVDPKYKKISVGHTIRVFTHNKHLSKIYFLNFLLKFFFAWMIIYTPIYLHEYLGLPWDKIGMIFTIMLLPFVLLPYHLGKLSDKIGEKKMLKIGFFIISLATMTIPLIMVPAVWMLASVLFLTRVGAATIEIMTESYFFKYVTEENADEIGFFRNTTPVSFIVAPLVGLPVLYFLPSFKYLFFVLGAIMLSGVFVSLRLRDIK